MEGKFWYLPRTTKLLLFIAVSLFLFSGNHARAEDAITLIPGQDTSVLAAPDTAPVPPIPGESSANQTPIEPSVVTDVTPQVQAPSDSVDPAIGAQTIQTLTSDYPPGGYYFLQPKNSVYLPNVDLTGALTEDFPIIVPPGRNNVQPDLKLQYNNQDNDNGNLFGYGWSINIPFIQLINRYGIDNFYVNTSTYYSSLSGELVNINTTTYWAKVENGDFLVYTFSSSTWTVTDKKGTIYKFGMDSSTQQFDASSTSHIFKWMLQEVRDLNSNFIKYEYFKDSGQIYPSVITYTGNSTTAGIFTVNFLRESRSDAMPQYKSGFRVTTAYRINEIDIKVSGNLVRKYTLGFTTGVNGVRSLLSSLTDQGQDENGNLITSPSTYFTYSTSTEGWSQDPDWQAVPERLDQGTYTGDVNGDGLPDLVRSSESVANNTSTRVTYLNNGNKGWTFNANYVPTTTFYNADAGVSDKGIRVIDVNGDGKDDLIGSNYSGSTESRYYFHNNGSGWDGSDTTYAPSSGYYISDTWTGTDTSVRLVDVTGDGLVDLVRLCSQATHINNGHDLDSGPAGYWSSPICDKGVIFGDVNGDGLIDLIQGTQTGSQSFDKKVYLNNGQGWVLESSFTQPAAIFNPDAAWDARKDLGVRAVDVNGDGLVDLVTSYRYGYAGTGGTYINNGSGWTQDKSTWVSGWNFSDSQRDLGVQLVDVNGDGLPDIIKNGPIEWWPYVTVNRVDLNNTKKLSDQLISIKHSSGGTTLMNYQTTPTFMNGSSLANPDLPMTINTVSQIQITDGLGTTISTSYKYEGGKMYFGGSFDRKFAGFNEITKTDSVGNYTVTYYHQGDGSDSSHGEYNDSNYKINKPYRTESFDANSNLFMKDINRWDEATLTSSSRFVFLSQTVDYTYDGVGSHRDKALSFTYNTTSTGNLLQKIDWGEVTGSDDGTFSDIGNDKYTTDYVYALNTSSYILGLRSQETLTDQNSNKVKEDRLYYDNQSLGSVLKGNETKHEYWKATSTYTNTQKVYNTFGLVTQFIDARGKYSSSTYDSYNLYPVTSTNALNQKRIYSYDYSNGQPKQVIDENSLITQTVYDGLDRVVVIKKPDYSVTSTLVTTTAYSYIDQPVGKQIIQTDSLDATTSVVTYTYTDGLDRAIQKRKTTENPGIFAVSDVIYGNRGQVEKDSQPYFASGSASSTPTSTSNLFRIYAYDPLLRLAYANDAVGTTTNSYDRWKTTITDANGNSRKLYKDAQDNLVQVDENNLDSTYVTTYTYNGLGKLTNITDALGNVRSFTYDGMGRRLISEDLHVSSDTTYGTSTFAYDDNGNLTQKKDPNGQVVNYAYDNLNRLLTEDYTGKSGTEILYAYDNCYLGVGKLCTATTTSSVVVKYAYDPLGNKKIVTSTINSVNYITKYSYDRQGNPTLITYPDNSQVQYTYDSFGFVQSVSSKENSDGSFKTLIASISHSPHGQPTQIQYGSGATSTFVYDSDHLYRLINKVTSLPTSSPGYYGEGTLSGVYGLMSTSSSGVVGGPNESRNMFVNGLWLTQGMTYDDSFEGNMGYWKYWSATTSATATQDCTTSYVGSCSEKVYVPVSGNVWDVQYWQDIRVDSGINYTVKFRAKATVTTTVTFGVNQDHSPYLDYGLATGVVFTPNWKQYSYSFTSNGSDELARIFFYMGANTSTYWLDDVEVIPDFLNQVKNLSLETGMTNWYAWSNGGTGQSTNSVDCSNGTDGACSNKTIVNYSGQAWQVQLAQNTGVVTGTSYIISFDAKGATSSNEVVAINQNHDSYLDLTYNNFTLTNAWKSYMFDVTPTQGDNNVRLMFYLGSTTNTIWIDNVHMWPKQATKITSTPQFSAIYESSNTSTSATGYRIQVVQGGTDFSNPLWDSGQQILSPNTPAGSRTSNITYTGPALPSNGAKYFWRIKFWDNYNNEGKWSNGRDFFYTPGIAVQNLTFSYDRVGNITQIVDNGSTSTSKLNLYAYDNLNRLTSAKVTDSAKGGDYTKTYSYNAIGNITNSSDLGDYTYYGWQGSLYMNPNAPTSIGLTNYLYDKNGNVTSTSVGVKYSWDYRDQLATSTVNRVTSTYRYDQDGNRVLYRVIGGTTTTYPNKLYSTIGTTTIKQIYLGDMLIATIKGSNATATIYYVHSDQIGSSDVMTTASGTISEVTDYYPFGGVRLDERNNGFNEPKKFTGHEYDMDTGLNYFGARYQDGSRGQFVSQDPVFTALGDASKVKSLANKEQQDILSNPQELNSYSYVSNNPLIKIDRDGLAEVYIREMGPQNTGSFSTGFNSNYVTWGGHTMIKVNDTFYGFGPSSVNSVQRDSQQKFASDYKNQTWQVYDIGNKFDSKIVGQFDKLEQKQYEKGGEYRVLTNNCTEVVNSILENVGVYGKVPMKPITPNALSGKLNGIYAMDKAVGSLMNIFGQNYTPTVKSKRTEVVK
jgi:RHS repeat-associated protein